ncbi:ABC amino acid transporter, periplasmic ligand binding protein [Caballeronia arvi]|uniref:ABC amino acid transporter, periplasmic ligand binding protein n=1 Tax=Caballeronia arvi TaxID=1777135 RepID=A0A158K5U1_9BURK|nr:ABC amino acid transporter, periplasmic ligand binding protein [Caballeronia arvi]
MTSVLLHRCSDLLCTRWILLRFGFFAIDPLRGETIAFSAPYPLIEGFCLVRDESPVRTNADVDRANNRVTVGKGCAHDLFFMREVKAAQIVRAPTSPAVVRTFIDEELEIRRVDEGVGVRCRCAVAASDRRRIRRAGSAFRLAASGRLTGHGRAAG